MDKKYAPLLLALATSSPAAAQSEPVVDRYDMDRDCVRGYVVVDNEKYTFAYKNLLIASDQLLTDDKATVQCPGGQRVDVAAFKKAMIQSIKPMQAEKAAERKPYTAAMYPDRAQYLVKESDSTATYCPEWSMNFQGQGKLDEQTGSCVLEGVTHGKSKTPMPRIEQKKKNIPAVQSYRAISHLTPSGG